MFCSCMMNEDCCEPLMEPAALTTHCTKSDVMTSLFDFWTINHLTVTARQHTEFQLSYSKEKCQQRVRRGLGLENAAYQHILCIEFDMKLLDTLCSAAADLQINRFLEAFHVTRLGMTHADTTCSYSPSWEILIFNSFGPYSSLQLSSSLQPVWFRQLFNVCVYLVKCQIYSSVTNIQERCGFS